MAAPDRPGVLSRAAGVLALHQLDVRAASAVTVGPTAVDVFTVSPRFGTGPDHVRYHSETSTAGKWDPGNTVDADEFRRRVAAELGDRS